MWEQARLVRIRWSLFCPVAAGHTVWVPATLVPNNTAGRIRLWEELEYGRASMESDRLDREVETITSDK